MLKASERKTNKILRQGSRYIMHRDSTKWRIGERAINIEYVKKGEYKAQSNGQKFTKEHIREGMNRGVVSGS